MDVRKTIRVLLVDDHPVVRDGYRRLLDSEDDIAVVAEASDGEEALQKFDLVNPGVVVLDLNLPGMGGLEAITRLRAKDPDTHILVFSMHDSPVMIRRALDNGAAGFLHKSSVAEQMVEAVRMVADGKPFMNHSSLSSVMPVIKNGTVSPLSVLSKREFDVFRRLALGNSIAEIAKDLSISPKTAGVHQTNIMHKLELRNAADLARLAIRCGVVEI